MRGAQDQEATLTKELQMVSDVKNDPAVLITLQYVNSNTIFLLRLQKVKEYEAALSEAKLRYRDGQETRDAEALLAQAKGLLEQSRQELVAQLKVQMEVTINEGQTAKEHYTMSKKELDDKLNNMAKYSSLLTNIEGSKRSIDFVNDHIRDVRLAARTNRNNVVEWENAPEIDAPVPVRPNWRQNMTMGLIFSLLLAGGMVF